MEEIIVDAVVEKLTSVTDFVNDRLSKYGFEGKVLHKIDIAVDELFSNIARYSYGDKGGKVTIKVDYDEIEHKASITFIDEGIEYNPLEQPEPDLTSVEDDDTIGGLGIFITKNIMDDIKYEYSDGRNILIIYKNA